MAIPTIHYIAPNFTSIHINGITYYFSYTTCIAFTNKDGLHVSENVWSETTGKHLNHIDRRKSKRIKYNVFCTMLGAL